MSSPLDSPDVLNTLVPLSDIGMTSASMGSMKLPSLDSINLKQQKQQVRLFRSKRLDSGDSYENLQRLASALVPTPHHNHGHPSHGQANSHTLDHVHVHGQGQGHGQGHVSVSAMGTGTVNHVHASITASTQTPQSQLCSASLPSRTTSPARQAGVGVGVRSCSGSMPNGVGAAGDSSLRRFHTNSSCLSSSLSLTGPTQTAQSAQSAQSLPSASSKCLTAIPEVSSEPLAGAGAGAGGVSATPAVPRHAQKLLEFSLSSVGRSFIDESSHVAQQVSLTTPETPTPNISPSSQICNSDAFSNDFVPPTTAAAAAQTAAAAAATATSTSAGRAGNIPLAEFGGSWDLLELDLQLNEVNLDPCYDTDVEECIFLGDGVGAGSATGGIGQTDADDDSDDDDSVVVDDPFGMLPTKPTPPDSLDL